MLRLTDFGRQTVQMLSSQHNVSQDAVETLAAAMSFNGGTMAQFSHPELGGSGQWMQGGMTMVGDMFNSGLSMTVNNVCTGLSMAMQRGQIFEAPLPSEPGGRWWPDELGNPTTTGGQNDMRYGVFPGARRIAIEQGGSVTQFDSGDHTVYGVSQQQDGGGMRLTFSSQFGEFGVYDLPSVQGGGAAGTGGSQQLVSPQPFQASQQQPQQPSQMQTQSSGGFLPQPNMPPLQPEMPPMDAQQAPPVNEQNGGWPQQNMHQRQPGQSFAASSASSSMGAMPAQDGDAMATLERLASLVEKGLLTREEFDAKKTDLLSRI